MSVASADLSVPLVTGAITLAIQTIFYILKDRDPYIRGLERRTKEYSYLKAQREAHELAGTEPPEEDKQRMLDYISRSRRWYELNHTEAAKNARWLALLATCIIMAYACATFLPALPTEAMPQVPFFIFTQQLAVVCGIGYCYMWLYRRIRRAMAEFLLGLSKKHSYFAYLKERRED